MYMFEFIVKICKVSVMLFVNNLNIRHLLLINVLTVGFVIQQNPVSKERVYVFCSCIYLAKSWRWLVSKLFQELVWQGETVLNWCRKTFVFRVVVQSNKLATVMYCVKWCPDTVEHWPAEYQILACFKVSFFFYLIILLGQPFGSLYNGF